MSVGTGPAWLLRDTFIRLRGDASVEPLPVGDGFWAELAQGRLGTFHNEYLVTMSSIKEHWRQWEMHPNGDEIIILLCGKATLLMQVDIGVRRLPFDTPYTFHIVPKGTWHTMEVSEPANLLFITAGEGTEHQAIG
ncbi:MAG: hypothetical protein GKR94_19585 [Gammaproteobacteria bacterium]|nr:hypothetical protein [Gammaproteobacteria bacterium]